VQHAALNNGLVTNGTYTWKTYAESLDEAGVSWKCYQGADNYGTNVLEFMGQFQKADPSSSLYKNAMTTQPYGQFELDAINDSLPTVSWIFPTSTQSEHPNYLPAAGAEGEYVTTAKAASGNPSDHLWVGPGFRVPMIIVSPWTAGGWVFSEQSDHTSSLRFLERGHRPHIG
jgi:phospholipase C